MHAEKIKDFILSSIVTKKCRYCGKIISLNNLLCDSCEKDLPVINGKKCNYCGAEKKRCNCKSHRMKYDGLTSPFYYEKGVKEAILQLKFSEKDYLAYTLAQDMTNSVSKDYDNISFDFVSYVPFSARQKMTRAYNQSELLAEHLSAFLNLPLKNVLVKIFDTGIQHSLKANNRTGNVAGAYDVKSSADVNGQTILLVDDIKTTGTTLNECAKVLKINGAEKVFCVTAALSGRKVKKKTDNNDNDS